MAAVCLYLLGVARPASAHHAFAAEFEKDKCADFTGTLTNIDWENPHAYFTMDVKGNDGKTVQMTFETSSLSTLKRAGTSKADFVNGYGKGVTVRGCPAKNGNKTRPPRITSSSPMARRIASARMSRVCFRGTSSLPAINKEEF